MNNIDLMQAFKMLVEGRQTGSVRKSVVDKVIDSRLTRNKTRKGAKHKHNKTFLSRQIMSVTPAQYRRLHLGCIKGATSNGLNRYV